MDVRTLQFSSQITLPGSITIDGTGSALQAARLWASPRYGQRPSAGPSRAILARADRVHAMLDALKNEVHGMDNASKAAACSLLV